ncbi:hypothetical protein HaLaN_04548, partial [Haematococcus lacustris]
MAIEDSCSCKAHHIKLDTKAIYGLMRTAGMLPANITSFNTFRNGVAGPRVSEARRNTQQWNDSIKLQLGLYGTQEKVLEHYFHELEEEAAIMS